MYRWEKPLDGQQQAISAQPSIDHMRGPQRRDTPRKKRWSLSKEDIKTSTTWMQCYNSVNKTLSTAVRGSMRVWDWEENDRPKLTSYDPIQYRTVEGKHRQWQPGSEHQPKDQPNEDHENSIKYTQITHCFVALWEESRLCHAASWSVTDEIVVVFWSDLFHACRSENKESSSGGQ